MNFRELLMCAKDGAPAAVNEITDMYTKNLL
jgi:hypothetical protein